MLNKTSDKIHKRKIYSQEASLTVEAALVMPIFLYFIMAFLYVIQIFTLQERIQSEMTKMGLELSKSAYFYKDFPDIGEALEFDKSLFGSEFDTIANQTIDDVISGSSLKLYAIKFLDQDWVNKSCMKNGFQGIDFFSSSIRNDENCIDIVLKYKIHIPVKIFVIKDINMLQRVRLRAWTGHQVAAAYEAETGNEDEMIYITRTGKVYHKSAECSHIKLSVRAVQGIPYELRNNYGAKYKRCEECCKGANGENSVYYITSEGTRYHSKRDCHTIKRDVRKIPIAEAGDRKPCSRCYK